MGQPAARQGDKIVAIDVHTVVTPTPAGPVAAPVPFPFNGPLTSGLSADVKIGGLPAAVVGSSGDNAPPHLTPPPTSFQVPPNNHGVVQAGSRTVFINGKGAARNGDPAQTCDELGKPGKVVAAGTVLVGG